MANIYKPSILLPITVAQELRRVLLAEADAPVGSYRQIQVMTPAAPTVMGAVYPDPRYFDEKSKMPLRNLQEAIGANRVYKLATLPPAAHIPMRLLPQQELWLACEEKTGACSIFVEFRLPYGVTA